MAQPSHPCVKPGLHNRQIFFLSFPSSRLEYLALARAPKPVWPPDDTACPLTGVFVINVYVLKVSFAAIFVSCMKVGSVNQFNILFYQLGCLWRAQFIKYFGFVPWGEGRGGIPSNLWWGCAVWLSKSLPYQHLWGKCKEVPSGIFGSQNERYQLLGSLSNDDGDGNKNGKKAVGLY